ncbi:hypothetical protein ACFL3T_00925 [Patescibacteria group bacterium]
MKNLYSFSDNPLNTDKLVYLTIRKAPKSKIEGPAGSAEKQSDALKVAETMDKLSLMMGKIDDKIKFYEGKVAKHSILGNYAKKYHPRIKRRLKWEKGELLQYKILKKRMEKVSEQLNKIETERDGSYSKVAMETLDKINTTIDKQAKIWRMDLRKDMLGKLKNDAFKELQNNRINLASIKNMFVLMKSGETITHKKGYKISRKGNKMVLEYKKITKEFSFSVKGKKLNWVIKDEKGLDVSSKIQRGALEDLFEGESGEDSEGLSKETNFYYYKPESAVNTYANYRVKDKIKAAKKTTTTTAAAVAEGGSKTPMKPKVLGRPKPTVKRTPVKAKAAERKREYVTPASTTQATLNVAKQALRKVPEVKESPATLKATNDWGNNLARDIGIHTNALLSRITVFKAWRKAGKTMKQYQAFKRNMGEVGKEVKTANGVDKIRAANKLAAVYRTYLANLPTEVEDKLKVKITAAPQNNAQIALNKAVFPVVPEEAPKAKVMVAQKPKAKPGLDVKGDKMAKNVVEQYFKNHKISEAIATTLNSIENGSQINVKALLNKTHGAMTTIALVTGVKKITNVVESKSKQMQMKIEHVAGSKTTLTITRNGVEYKIAETNGKKLRINTQQLAKLKKAIPAGPTNAPAVKKALAAKERKERTPGLKNWASQNAQMLKDIRKEFIVHNDAALTKMYPDHGSSVLIRLNTLNRSLNDPKISFVKAVQICKDLRRGFRHLQKRAKERKIAYVGKNVKANISTMTTLKFPPAPKNPTVAEQRLIKAEDKRLAGMKKFTDIKVS